MNTQQKINDILGEIKAALDEHQVYFDLSEYSVSVDDDEEFCLLVQFKTLDPKSQDSKLVAINQTLEFMMDDEGNIFMFVGEDSEISVSAVNIYCQLYWGEVLKPID